MRLLRHAVASPGHPAGSRDRLWPAEVEVAVVAQDMRPVHRPRAGRRRRGRASAAGDCGPLRVFIPCGAASRRVHGGWGIELDASDLLPRLGGLPLLATLRDLAIAYGLAFLIGWNREREDRSAGLRTFPLVAIASCGFIQATEGMLAGHQEGLARVIEGVITGIGFIGGGAIIKTGAEVHGTATAASIWATAAIGVAVALQSYHVAVVVCLFTIITLYVLSRLKPQEKG